MNKQYTIIRCGKLFDGITADWKRGWSILIENDRIAEVGPRIPEPEGARIIDLSDCQVTPGMIDAHMHMDFFDWHTVREEVYTTSEESKTLAIARTAKKALARGFTTVRHIGGITSKGYGVLDVKRSIEKGYLEGSRIVAAPLFLCSAGSHGDLSQGFSQNPELSSILQSHRTTLGAGKDFFVNAVREQVKYGSDFLKIMATGGFFTPNDTPIQQQLNDEELQAIITTAHELGKTVTAHVYTNELMQKLIRFGIDGMEHGSLMNEQTAAIFEEKGLYLVPTFCPYEEAVHYDPEAIKLKQPEFRRKLEMYKDVLQAGRKVICKSKIRLGYGTDFVANHQNYESGYEYEAWMNNGMDPFRALMAATSVNAGILQLEDQIGTIEKGKLADISAWKRDLMTDPKALLDCAFVMKEGKEYATESCL
ncbi:MAG: amidohydrolase family protein [Lachnospiraceae bacterium]|nr:amidohydrolase family protein [Lachnospiraceae bacterium]